MVKSGKLVYSSAEGRLDRVCPRCRANPCQCIDGQAQPAARQDVRIQRSNRGRGGKTVTIISGLTLEPGELDALGALLRKQCGTGGTVKEGIIELQGDNRDQAAALLRQKGYRVKLSGG